MAVSSQLAVDGTAQIQVTDDGCRGQIKYFAHSGFQFVVLDGAGTKGINHDGNGLGNADSVSQLNFALIGQAGSDNVLGNPAGSICGRAVNLAGVLARESAAASLGAMVLFTRTQSLGDHQSLILAPFYLLMLFGLCAKLTQQKAKPWLRNAAAGVLAVFLVVNFGNALRLPGKSVQTLALSSESLDLTRRTDLAQMRAVTDFVLEHCTEDQTVYINMDSNGYSGTTFAYSDPAHPQLQTMILWESSVPSTHGFPTGIWTSEYVMVTDRVDEGGIVGPINAALRTQSPAAVHYEYMTEFPLDGITLYCYRRTARPDAEEADYFKQVFAEYDARWPEIFSQRIDEYMQSVQ